jgi:hypothetical protein
VRQFLVTKFVCSRCGGNLRLTYDVPASCPKHAAGEPTGADMVQQAVAIEPCECVTSRLDEVLRAVKVLTGQKELP